MDKKNKLSSILGMIIVVLGIIVFLKWNPYYLWKFKFMIRGWWTLLIIIPSVISILKRGPRAFNLIPCIIGIVLLLSARYIINVYWIRRYLIPVLLILLGGIVVFLGKSKNK